MTLPLKLKQITPSMQVGALLLINALSASAMANTCDAPSSLKQALGDDYFDIEFTIEKANNSNWSGMEATRASNALLSVSTQNESTVDAALKTKARELLEKFHASRYTKALGRRQLCKGSMSQRRLVDFSSELRIVESTPRTTNSSIQRLSYLEEAYSDGDRMSFDQKIILELPTASQWRVLADNSIANSQVNRRRVETGHSVVSQIDTQLTFTAQGIKISQTNYINGYRDNWATWTMKR